MNESRGPVRVVAAVVEAGGKYLLAKRPAHKSQAGFWEFPGGKVEPGEASEDALARELAEELAAHGVRVGELVGIADHDYGAGVLRIEAYRVTCDLESLRCLEHDEIGWFQVTELKALPLAAADVFLTDLLQ